MGWAGYFTDSFPKNPTAQDLYEEWKSNEIRGDSGYDIEVHALASRRTQREPGAKDYTLWVYGTPNWGTNSTPCIFTVLIAYYPKKQEILFKDFGLEEYDNPPASFLKALPKDIGNERDNKARAIIEEKQALKNARTKTLRKALTNGTRITFGQPVRLTNGEEHEWLHISQYTPPEGGRKQTVVTTPKGLPINLGRNWRARITAYILAGEETPITL